MHPALTELFEFYHQQDNGDVATHLVGCPSCQLDIQHFVALGEFFQNESRCEPPAQVVLNAIHLFQDAHE